MSIITNTIRNTGSFLRNVSNINNIIIHNTGVNRTGIDCRESLNRHRIHWRNLGWTNDGYHEIIARDGRVFILHEPNHIANGAGVHNGTVYHISCEGLGNQITAIQRTRLLERIRFNQNRFNVANARVLGHNELSGQFTSCPNINMNNVRRDINKNTPPANTTLQVGSNIKIRKGARYFDPPNSIIPQNVINRQNNSIIEIRGNRIVFGVNGAITGTVNRNDII